MNMIKERSLYLVITEEYGRGRSAPEIAKAAIAGGVDIIQMREKNKPREELLRLGRELAAICREGRGEKGNVIFIVNDDPELAKETGADGVHLGQEDLRLCAVARARDILGSDKIIGLSTGSAEEVKRANHEDVDYIAFGPVFETKIKEGCAGTEEVEEVLGLSQKKVFFIGGIALSNLDGLLAKGARNISLIREICGSDDITGRTKKLKAKLDGA